MNMGVNRTGVRIVYHGHGISVQEAACIVCKRVVLMFFVVVLFKRNRYLEYVWILSESTNLSYIVVN
jgi:hypothetical protein